MDEFIGFLFSENFFAILVISLLVVLAERQKKLANKIDNLVINMRAIRDFIEESKKREDFERELDKLERMK